MDNLIPKKNSSENIELKVEGDIRVHTFPNSISSRVNIITWVFSLHQKGYPKTLINKGFAFAENVTQKELRNPKKYNNEKFLAYVATHNKNNPELFTEILLKI